MLIIFTKYFIVSLCSVFQSVSIIALCWRSGSPEVVSEKVVVYRRCMGEGNETGLYRRESHCGAILVKTSANSRGALRPGCPYSWDKGPGCCIPMSISHGIQAAIRDGIWFIWGNFLQSQAIPREGEMVTEVEVSELQDFQQLKAYVFLFFFGTCLSVPQRILGSTSQSLRLWHFRHRSLPWVL